MPLIKSAFATAAACFSQMTASYVKTVHSNRNSNNPIANLCYFDL